MKLETSLGLCVVLSLCACGASTPAPKADAAEDGAPETTSNQSSLDVDAEVGAMNEGAVMSAFKSAQSSIFKCFADGSGRLPYLGGLVRFSLRVDKQGKAKVAFLSDSTLGDRATEECMLDTLRGQSWPAPQGGREGIAETEFTFDPASGVRTPVSWSPDDVGKNLGQAKGALATCRQGVGAGQMKATLYVDTNGRVESVGVSGADPKSEKAAACIVNALKDVKFNSPGSYAAKVSISG